MLAHFTPGPSDQWVFFGVDKLNRDVIQIRLLEDDVLQQWGGDEPKDQIKLVKGRGPATTLKGHFGLLKYWGADPHNRIAVDQAFSSAIAYAEFLKARLPNE